MPTKTLVVNFFGGPGTGKSTMTAAVFASLKWRGYNAEMALEYAKRKVWEGSAHVLDDQLYVLGKQHHTLKVLDGQVDIALTDSPLLLSMIYNSDLGSKFDEVVLERIMDFNNLNIFLRRKKEYCPLGRLQTETEAIEIDNNIKTLLGSQRFSYVEYDAGKDSIEPIVNLIADKYFKLNEQFDSSLVAPSLII